MELLSVPMFIYFVVPVIHILLMSGRLNLLQYNCKINIVLLYEGFRKENYMSDSFTYLIVTNRYFSSR